VVEDTVDDHSRAKTRKIDLIISHKTQTQPVSTSLTSISQLLNPAACPNVHKNWLMDAHLQSLLSDCINGESGGLGVAGGSALSFICGVDSLAFEVWRGMVEVVRGVCDGVNEYGDDIGDGDVGEERQERY
jgi:hypothetical protein